MPKEVAAILAAYYVTSIDLAGRLGRFRLAFRDRAHAFYLSPQSSKDRRGMLCDAALCIASERTSP